jgi:hypothetical protein
MPNIVLLALAATVVLMSKHAVADLYLQTPYQYLNKERTAIQGLRPCRHPCRANAARLFGAGRALRSQPCMSRDNFFWPPKQHALLACLRRA